MQRFLSCFVGRGADAADAGYTPIRRLGEGVCGPVMLARKQDGQQLCAVKTCALAAPLWQLAMQQRECQALCAVGGRHVNLVEPLEVVLDGSRILLSLRSCSGGTLEAYCKQHRVSEDMACYLLKQLVAVVQHMHSREIAYRDIKLQNVLLDKPGSRRSPPQLVLCDLGTAKSWRGRASPAMATFVGTPGFMSPQVLASMFNCPEPKADDAPAARASEDVSSHSSASRSSHTYDASKADVWSIGALLYYMLHRHLPYGYDSFGAKLPPQQALATLYQLEAAHTWQEAAGAGSLRRVSPEAADLLAGMLDPDEGRRLSMAEVQQHPWFNRRLPDHLAAALEQQARQQQLLDAAARGERARCKLLAREAVDVLFELSRSPHAMARLQQEGRCLSVPLSLLGSQLSASAQNSQPDEQQVVQQMEAVLLQLQQEAAAAGLPPSSTPATAASSSPSSSKQPRHEAPQQQLPSSVSSKPTDDTCFHLQACSSAVPPGLQPALLPVEA